LLGSLHKYKSLPQNSYSCSFMSRLLQVPSYEARRFIAVFEHYVLLGDWPNAAKFLWNLAKAKTSIDREAAVYIIKVTELHKLKYPLASDLPKVVSLPQEVKNALIALQREY